MFWICWVEEGVGWRVTSLTRKSGNDNDKLTIAMACINSSSEFLDYCINHGTPEFLLANCCNRTVSLRIRHVCEEVMAHGMAMNCLS